MASFQDLRAAGGEAQWWEGDYWEDAQCAMSGAAAELPSAARYATTARFQADAASQIAYDMCGYVQQLQMTVVQLQSKVSELEAWKKTALEDVRQLREEHKMLKRMANSDGQASNSSSSSRGAAAMQRSLPTSDASSKASVDVPSGFFMKETDTSTDGDTASSATPSGGETPSTILGDHTELEGVKVISVDIDGVVCERAEWRILQLSAKLRGKMGRALVSSAFSASGLEDLHLMIHANDKYIAQGLRSKKQKELYAKKVTEGPLDACLKLKVPSCPAGREVQFYLAVGSQRKGPFKHCFSESQYCGCEDFGVDWLKQLDSDRSLTVCVEIVKQDA